MNKEQRSNKKWWLGMILAVVGLVSFAIASPIFADDVTGSLDINGGSLTMATADDPTFSAITLDGTDQSSSDPIDIDVNDSTGTGNGWKLQVTSTTFTNGGGKTLPNTALAITGVSSVCDTTCTNPTNGTSYSLTVPADTVAPTAVTFFNSAVDTGMGDFTVTPTFELSVPATAYAGTYNSTVTITIASGP